MKTLVISLVVGLAVLAPGSSVFAQAGSAESEAVKTNLKRMEDSWAKAFLDKDHGVAVISGMLADDFAGYSSKGEMVDKSKLLDTYRNNTDTITASTNADMQVHVYDKDLASVTGTSSETGTDKAGQSYSRKYIWVDTWMQRNGK
jgi:Domain of unknown function (DUF4440)